MNPIEKLIEYKKTLAAVKVDMIKVGNHALAAEADVRIDGVQHCIEILENN